MKARSDSPLMPRHVDCDAGQEYLTEIVDRAAIYEASASNEFDLQDPSKAMDDLQKLISNLRATTEPIPSTQSANLSSSSVPFAKLVAGCAAGNRRDAIKSLVQNLATSFPGATIQTGIGSSKLRRYLDPTLGWLGPESELFRDFSQDWELMQQSAETRSAVDQTSVTGVGVQRDSANQSKDVSGDYTTRAATTPSESNDQVIIVLNRPNDLPDQRDDLVIIKMTGPGVDWQVGDDFASWSKTLATVVWNRPAWTVPRWVYLNGNRKVIALTVVACLLLGALFPTPYSVNADVRIEPQSPRIVSAPFEALIEDVKVHPGDVVKAGQTLVTLDGRPLRLERQSLDAEIHQSAKQKDISLAAGRIAEAQQAQLKYQQLMRRRDLIDRRLEQLTITSPIDGVVVSGDLRRSIGASLELGRALIEIAPLESVIVEIAIPEYEISMVNERAQTKIRVDASGTPTIQEMITEIYPTGELREDKVVFISLIELDNKDGAFRPGMTGKATVYGAYRPFVWPYVRRAIDQVTWLIGL